MVLVSVITVFGIVVGIFLCILLLSLNNLNRTANRFLGLIMIVSSLIICGFGITKFGLYHKMPHLIAVASIMIFLITPLFYFYIKALTQENFVFSKRMYFHFTPFVLLLLYMLPFYIQDAQTKLAIYNSESFSREHKIIIMLQVVHALIYMYFAKKILNLHVRNIKNSVSSIEKINLNWIRTGINFFIFIIIFVGLSLTLLFFGIRIHSIYSEFIPAAISVAIVSMGFMGLRQPIIFPGIKNFPQSRKYEKSALTNEQSAEYIEQLQALMKNQKPYLRNDLTLKKLSELLSISQNHLSQIINEQLNQNFFDYINSYRIEEAKSLLISADAKQFTILAIAHEAGFNSKSSFNAAFKKHTGKTPTQFINEWLRAKTC